jgi:hypothetical protein
MSTWIFTEATTEHQTPLLSETNDMDDKSQSGASPAGWGKKITTLGVGMVTTSIILVFAGVSGAALHNTLQLGGLAIAVVGLVVWKILKK